MRLADRTAARGTAPAESGDARYYEGWVVTEMVTQ
jgi:hypothetical protein